MSEEKVCGTKTLGCQNYEFHEEARAKFVTLSRWQRQKVLNGKKLALGAEQRAGWSGKLPFYLFKCENEKCGRIAKDYPHGYIHRQYLLCSTCGQHHDFVPWWAEFVMFWDTLRLAIRVRKMKAEAEGKKK